MGYKCSLKYHLVICPKFRRKSLPVFSCQYFLLNHYNDLMFKHNRFKILNVNGDVDHLHILFESFPSISISSVVNKIKSKLSWHIRRDMPLDFGDCGFHWSGGYYVDSVGNVSLSKIRNYINNQ